MTGFNHVLAGGIIAVTLPAPIAPLAALASHFVLDMTPHFGRHPLIYPYTKQFIWWLVGDAILCFVSLGFSLWLFPSLWPIIIVTVFFSTLPDFLWLIDGKITWLKGFFRFAEKIQWGERPWGWTLEIVYAAIFSYALIFLSY